MLWSKVVLLVVYAGLSAAHEPPGHATPKLFGGRRVLSELKSQGVFPNREGPSRTKQPAFPRAEGADDVGKQTSLQRRQNKSGRCGSGRGSCASGYCCSEEGWCGLGEDYCTAPDCQLNYGSGCDGNKKPSGTDTSKIARPKLGRVQYGGVGIYDCVVNGDIALTFDDGPYDYTEDLLDKLAEYEAKATFFITGNNLGKGIINDPDHPWRAVIQRMADEGHQIASHTWSHQNFSQLSTTQARDQMIYNEIALNDILGYFPTYMRPPYSICPAACQSLLAQLGYHVVYFDLDTEGYLHDDAGQIQTSKDIWDDAVDGADPCRDSYLQIEHDIHYQTVYNLTDHILASLFAHGFRAVTVGQCLGDPPANWYRAGGSAPLPDYTFSARAPTGTAACLQPTTTTTTRRPPTTTTATTKTSPTPTGALKVSPDGTCGPGVTCAGSRYGNCCSRNGWCGASIDYCGGGCQSPFGVCSNPDAGLPADSPITPAGTSGAGPGR